MALLGTAEINLLASTAESAMVDTCVIYRYAEVEAAYGGFAGTATAAGTVACHVARASLVTPELRINAEQAAPDTNWMILMPRGTDVRDHDVITWSNSYGGGTAAVVERLPRTWEVTRRAFCRNANDVSLA